MTKIVIASDHGGFELKNKIREYLYKKDFNVTDIGCDTPESCDYPDYAHRLCEYVLENNCKGILVCGTGIGMSIAANKHKGIRASHCTDTYTARMTRMHNDSNVLCLGERTTGVGLALDIVEIWLNTAFEGGRHQARIDKIELEK